MPLLKKNPNPFLIFSQNMYLKLRRFVFWNKVKNKNEFDHKKIQAIVAGDIIAF